MDRYSSLDLSFSSELLCHPMATMNLNTAKTQANWRSYSLRRCVCVGETLLLFLFFGLLPRPRGG